MDFVKSHFAKMQLWKVEHFFDHKKVPVVPTYNHKWNFKSKLSSIFHFWLANDGWISQILCVKGTTHAHLGPIWYHSEPSPTPQTSFLVGIFFAKTALVRKVVIGCMTCSEHNQARNPRAKSLPFWSKTDMDSVKKNCYLAQI